MEGKENDTDNYFCVFQLLFLTHNTILGISLPLYIPHMCTYTTHVHTLKQ